MDFNEEEYTTLIMNSYHLQKENRSWLQETGRNYTTCIQRGRFGVVAECMKPKANSTGQYVQYFNQATWESAVHHWSENTNLQRWTVLSTFLVKK